MRHMLKLLARPFLLALPLGLFFLNGAISAAPTPLSLSSGAAADSDLDAALFYDILRAEMLAQSGLRESDLPVADRPRRYHINEVDGVFIASTEEAD